MDTKCNIICNLLLEIYKDYNAEQTKQIAYHVLINNHFDITQDEIPYFFEGICGNGVYTYWIGNSPYNYFTKFYDYRKLVESDKYQVSDADLKKCSDYFKKAGDNYDVYEFILFVYKDHNEDMTAKIVSKVLNDGLRGKLGGFFEVGMWDVDYVKNVLNNMRGGNYGGHYYKEICDIELAKSPTWVKILAPAGISATWIYDHLMALAL